MIVRVLGVAYIQEDFGKKRLVCTFGADKLNGIIVNEDAL